MCFHYGNHKARVRKVASDIKSPSGNPIDARLGSIFEPGLMRGPGEKGAGKYLMTIVAAVVAVLLLGYLVVALVKPELF